MNQVYLDSARLLTRVAPLVLGGSVVAVRHEDPEKASARKASERVSARAG